MRAVDPPLQRRRPGGVVVLVVVLASLALCGFANALIWRTAVVQELMRKADPGATAWLGSATFTILMLAYGACAAWSAIGVWHRRRWAVSAYVAWCASMAAAVVYFRSFDPSEARTGNMVAGAIGCAVFLLVCPYIARQTRVASEPA